MDLTFVFKLALLYCRVEEEWISEKKTTPSGPKTKPSPLQNVGKHYEILFSNELVQDLSEKTFEPNLKKISQKVRLMRGFHGNSDNLRK